MGVSLAVRNPGFCGTTLTYVMQSDESLSREDIFEAVFIQCDFQSVENRGVKMMTKRLC
ncbi:hypothetical protein ES703_64371 [subsurface metagenome]